MRDYKESEAHKQVRLREAEMMREAAREQEEKECRRCGKLLESSDPFDALCTCAYDDWHEDEQWHDEHLADDYDEDER